MLKGTPSPYEFESDIFVSSALQKSAKCENVEMYYVENEFMTCSQVVLIERCYFDIFC